MSSTAEPDASRQPDLWALFALTWAGSVLFHLVGNPRLAPEWGRGLLAVTALAVLARPRNPWLGAGLAVAVLTNVWLEAPLLGNHWLLQGFLALVVLGSVVVSRGDASRSMATLVGPARLTLLAFYGFAAFAKLNGDFFDPAVSCAVFYLRESASSWGAPGLVDWLPSGGLRTVAVAVAAIELSVPLLLFLRRTRRVGVVVALVFHFVLALDRTHQFFDFSSVLAVLFLLFLEPDVRSRMWDGVDRASAWVGARWSSGPELARTFCFALVSLVAVSACGPDEWDVVGRLRAIGVWSWIAVGALMIGGVLWALRTGPRPGHARHLLLGSRPSWILVVPLVAFLNGLTPYLEFKSAYGWNMYANLAVVDGESNHLVIRSGLPLTDVHERLVRVVESTDEQLLYYDGDPWLLPEIQLLDHLADRPGVVVEGEIDGETVRYEGGGEGRPAWRQKFQLFRAVDSDGPTSCQPSFGPAR